MSWNLAIPLKAATGVELAEGLGLPQFQTDKTYSLVQNGLIDQGGVTGVLAVGNHVISLPAPFTKQILTIQLTGIDGVSSVRINSATTNLNQIGVTVASAATALYWFAKGV